MKSNEETVSFETLTQGLSFKKHPISDTAFAIYDESSNSYWDGFNYIKSWRNAMYFTTELRCRNYIAHNKNLSKDAEVVAFCFSIKRKPGTSYKDNQNILHFSMFRIEQGIF